MKTAAAIEAANRRFHRLSPAAKRVAIARDVLLCLRKGTIRATLGDYFEPTGVTKDRFWALADKDQIQPFLLSRSVRCDACAIGACFVSAARLGNKATAAADPLSYPRRYFSKRQLGMMEFAFEGWEPCFRNSMAGIGGVTPPDQELAAAFFNNTGNPTNRLRKIMRNVIANRGEFKP